MLTPEQARDLVAHFGSIEGAARAIGVSRSTLRYWLDPEPHRARMRVHYAEMSGVAYSRKMLLNRRVKALIRREQRRLNTEV